MPRALPALIAFTLWTLSAQAQTSKSKPTRVTIMPPLAVGVAAQVAQSLEPLLVEAVAKQVGTEALSLNEINALLGVERAKDAVGCTDVICASELAVALNAPLVVTGIVHQIDTLTYVSLVLLDAYEQRALARSREALDDGGSHAAVKRAVARLFGGKDAGSSTQQVTERFKNRLVYLAERPVDCSDAKDCIVRKQARIDDISRVLGDAMLKDRTLAHQRRALELRKSALLREIDGLRSVSPTVQAPAPPTSHVTPASPGGSGKAGVEAELQRTQQALSEVYDTYYNRDKRAALTRRIQTLRAKLALYAELEELSHELRHTDWLQRPATAKAAVEQRMGQLVALLGD